MLTVNNKDYDLWEMMCFMNIYLIRHAQTTMNARGKVFSGITDVSLSVQGIEATKKTASNKLWSNIEHAYITPLVRTHQTADILFDKSVPRTIVPELAEMNFGDYEGRIMTAENCDDPVFYKWINAPENLTFPNGQNLSVHADSAFTAFKKIAENQVYKNIAIISHATTIRLIFSLMLTDSVNIFRKIPCDNGCVSKIVAKGDELKIKYINAPL